MNKESQQQRLEIFARTALDRSIQDLDSDTLDRLRLARNKAVLTSHAISREKKSRNNNAISRSIGKTLDIFTVGNGWLPVGGFAATATVVALSLSLWMVEPSLPSVDSFEDLAVLSANEDLELFDELEFYQWLEDEKQSHS
ncbi:MAG: DUF3619 family protein [Thiohalomonadales bacterium]